MNIAVTMDWPYAEEADNAVAGFYLHSAKPEWAITPVLHLPTLVKEPKLYRLWRNNEVVMIGSLAELRDYVETLVTIGEDS